MSNLKRNTFWSLLSIGTYAAGQWWILSFMARMGKVEQIGYYSLALSVVTPLAVFSNLNLRYLYVANRASDLAFSDFLSLRKWMFVITLLIILAVAFFSKYELIIKLLIITVGIYKLTESVSDMYFAFHQKNEQMSFITRSILIRSSLLFVFFTATFYFTKDILVSSCVIVLIYLTTLLFIDSRLASVKFNFVGGGLQFLKGNNRAYYKKLYRLFIMGLPMGMSLMIYSAIIAVPRFFIEKYIGIEQLGIYSALYYLYSSIVLISIGLADAALPSFVRLDNSGDQKAFWTLLFKYSKLTVVFIAGCVLIVSLFGDDLLTFSYGSLFSTYKELFILGIIVSGFEIINKFLSVCMTAKKILNLQPILSLVTFVNILFMCVHMRADITLTKVLYAQGFAFGFQMIATGIVLALTQKKSFIVSSHVV